MNVNHQTDRRRCGLLGDDHTQHTRASKGESLGISRWKSGRLSTAVGRTRDGPEPTASVAAVRQLYPDRGLDAPDLADLYGAPSRPSPAGRPWVLSNMVASLDGATAVDGVSGNMGGEGDRMVFDQIRAAADAIVVAAGTARAEDYGPPRADPGAAEARAERGQSVVPELVVLTRSGNLDTDARLFSEGHRPTVVVSGAAPTDRVAALDAVADVVVTAGDDVDPGEVLSLLARRGHRVVLLEGGPSLNGQWVAADMVDELCLTVAPLLVSGGSKRVALGPEPTPAAAMALAHVLEHDDALFLRYVRRR